ncbi:alcohol dehydrogenase catalytic domain-containing protein [Moorella naiadis]|uniref:zinc-dependent alcohol dehydrogenase n=1 Tax=Moorella naiadis (nom. illeg.) TaxID=3093670 RepID=UPI003D9C9C33
MIRAVMVAPGAIELQEVPVRDPGPNEVLVKVKACGICTWEQRFYRGIEGIYPFLGGHEIAGEVVSVGGQVAEKLYPGQKVAVASLTRCGECYYCRRGLDHLCANAGEKSTPGEYWGPAGFAEYIIARGYEVYPLDDTADPVQATFAEPLACVTKSINRGNLRFGDTAVILGAGVMGLLHLKLARLRGARVIISEPDAARREKALHLGAIAAIDPRHEDLPGKVKELTSGRGAEAVFFTAGGTPALAEGTKLLVKGGTLVVYGSIHPAVPLDLNPNDLHYDEYTLTGSIRHDKESFRQATALLAAGIVDVRDLISACFPFTEIDAAFKEAIRPETFRVVLTFLT